MSHKKNYFIYINNNTKVNVSEEVYKAYWKSVEHERYLERKYKQTCVSLDSILNNLQWNAIEFILVTEKNPTYESTIKSIEIQNLYQAINALPHHERMLIKALYFDGLSQTEYAISTGKTQQSISRHHRKIIKKLKTILNY